jgi:hypothetical protein
MRDGHVVVRLLYVDDINLAGRSREELLRIKEVFEKRAYHKTRELVTEGIVSVEKVSSQEQLADILTKNLAHVRHAELTTQLMS